jgi:hypothetical protein
LGRALPDSAVVRIEISGLDALPGHPLAAAMAEWISDSEFFTPYWQRPEYQAAMEGLSFFERTLDVSRDELWRTLTANGVLFGILPGSPPQFVAVFDTGEASFPTRFVAAVDEMMPRSEDGQAATLTSADGEGRTERRLGELLLITEGARIFVGNDTDALRKTVQQAAQLASSSTASETFSTRIDLNLPALRESSDLKDALKRPAVEAGGVAILGGWIDLLRDFNRITVTIEATGEDFSVRARAGETVGDPLPAGPAGFWAQGDASPLPLLDPQGVIYSASWYRDYGSLWNARETLLEPEVAAALTKADEEAGKQSEVLGASFRPSELFAQIGPHFRVVLLEGQSPYNEVVPPNVLPAAVAVFDLKDEQKVREWMGPVFRIFSLILNGDQNIMTTSEQHGDDELTVYSIPTTAEARRKGGRDRYNFRTTYTFAHGSFLIGTTPAAVKAVLDAMKQETVPATPEAGVTERQRLDARRIDGVLTQVDEALRRGLVLTAGWSSATAAAEIERLHRLAGQLGVVEAEAGFREAGFEYRIRWTGSANRAPTP